MSSSFIIQNIIKRNFPYLPFRKPIVMVYIKKKKSRVNISDVLFNPSQYLSSMLMDAHTFPSLPVGCSPIWLLSSLDKILAVLNLHRSLKQEFSSLILYIPCPIPQSTPFPKNPHSIQ